LRILKSSQKQTKCGFPKALKVKDKKIKPPMALNYGFPKATKIKEKEKRASYGHIISVSQRNLLST